MGTKNSVTGLLILLSILLPEPGKSQNLNFEANKRVALAELAKHPKPDTNRVIALNLLVNTAIFLKERKELQGYLTEALELSRRLNFRRGLGNAYMHKGNYFKSASKYDTALVYFDSVLIVAGNSQNEHLVAVKERALEQTGSIYYSQENYYTALDYYFEALKYTIGPREGRKIDIYSFVTEIYTTLNDLDKATEYALKNIALVQKDKDSTHHAHVYFRYIDICLEKKDLATAIDYLDKMSGFIPHPQQGQVNFGYYLKRGRVSYMQQKYEEAHQYFLEADKYATKGGHQNSQSVSLYYLAQTALQLGHYEEAKSYALQNLAVTEKMNTKTAKIEALLNLSASYDKVGNKAEALKLAQQAMQLKDSLVKETNAKQVHVLGAIYEYGKQQKEIVTLQNEKDRQLAAVKQKSFLNYIFIASIIVLLFLGYLGYINFRKGRQLFRQRQAMQEQKIIELEKDRQLLTIDAMLKGQEEERSRIAKDLHDGIGSLLSGTKLAFMNVKENEHLSPDGKILFDRSLCMLDNTIGDLRKVAQNLMPEALVKFGLHEALHDFCDSIQSSSGISVLYQHFGEKRKLANTAEVYTYRIIQELVNNAVKHAAASKIMVQLTMSKTKTGIAVEDDGKGFNKEVLKNRKGSGLANINYRARYFNGSCDIVTSPDNTGTSINIELIA